MLRIFDGDLRRAGSLSRREWLRIGGASLGGLTLANLASAAPVPATALDPEAGRAFGKAKSVIVIFLGGGPPQHETWDPKPEAPAEIRGGFGTIQTRTPGLSIGELMPLTANLTDQIAVLQLGKMVAVRPSAEMDKQIVVDLMTTGASTRTVGSTSGAPGKQGPDVQS